MRIGHGYDVHRVTEGDCIFLGGKKIECQFSLSAHSDGDVVIHAVIDALFGAAGLCDIGCHFPDSDERYRGISSIKLLKETSDIIKKAGFEPEYIDCTIIAQSPKLAPHIQDMRKIMADALEISSELINVKATTEEKLGFTGSGEGIAAHCVCLLKYPSVGDKNKGDSLKNLQCSYR